MNKINKYFWILLSSGLIAPAYAKTTILDLKSAMQDRYEKNCAIRDGYDLYEFPDIAKSLKPHVIHNKFVEEQAYVSNSFLLKNVEYKGVPVKKIDFSYGNMAKQINQTLYLDVSTLKAKNNFAKLKFNFQQSKEYAGLDVEKKGNLISVHCYWPDPNF